MLLLAIGLSSAAQTAQHASGAAAGSAPSTPLKDSGAPPSISLSPAVVQARGNFGQSLTQTLTLSNLTGDEFTFEMMAEDVVIKDGKRTFVAAGESEHSIAATAVFSQKTVVVKPFTSASVDVRFTIPAETKLRAAVAIFRGTNKIATSSGSVGMTASLGALITFNLSDNLNLTPEPVQVNPGTESSNLSISQWIKNTGTEPVLPEGVAALLDSKGALVGKANFPVQRLLPGERLEFKAEYPDQLQSGSYKALCSFQYESKTLTSDGAFTVK